MEKIDKKKIAIQCRSDGDGMEHTTYLQENRTSKENQDRFGSEHKYSSFGHFSGKRKEPKFVPYEPYKAAISPIVPVSKKCENISTHFVIDSQRVSSLASSIIQFDSMKKGDLNPKPDAKPVSGKECGEDCFKKIRQLEEKVTKLENENKDVKSQFKIQTEVNADLKKMLIASLGEDMHLKVQYMTEDKARLGMNVLQFTEELAYKEEEIEKLSVQCDVWKSKFDASCVMVDDLARWKVALADTLKNAISTLSTLTNEHRILSEELCATYGILKSTLSALDPNTPKFSASDQGPHNLLQLSKEVQELAASIQERLLGRASPRGSFVFTDKSFLESSPIVQNAMQVIKDYEKLPFLLNDAHIYQLGNDPGKTACRVLPHLCSKEPTVNCCNHCSGEIQLL